MEPNKGNDEQPIESPTERVTQGTQYPEQEIPGEHINHENVGNVIPSEEPPNAEGADGFNMTEQIQSISNNLLLSQQGIDLLSQMIWSQKGPLDDFSLADPLLDEKLTKLIRDRTVGIEAVLDEAMQFYQQKLLENQLNHLERLMKIFKSKKREMIFRRRPIPAGGGMAPDRSHEGIHQPLNEEIMLNPIQLIVQNFFQAKTLPDFDSTTKFMRFDVGGTYEVYVRSCDEEEEEAPQVNQSASLFDVLPESVIRQNILPFFSAFELFRMRGVSRGWRESIRGMWHVIFRREMREQLVAATLCNEVEIYFALLKLKSPFYHKFGIFLKAFLEVVDWDELLALINDNQAETRVKYLTLAILAMFGQNFGCNSVLELTAECWEDVKAYANAHLKEMVTSIFDRELVFPSNEQLSTMTEGFVRIYQFNEENLRELPSRLPLLLSLFLRQLHVFAYLKNTVNLSQKFLVLAKDRLKYLSQDWSQKKGFLEGAYKILLFRNCRIKDGKILVAREASGPSPSFLRTEEDDLIAGKRSEMEGFAKDLAEVTSKPPEETKEEPKTIEPQNMKLVDIEEIEPSHRYEPKVEAGAEKAEEELICDCALHRTGLFSQKPDYLIKRDNTETRIFMDEYTKLQMIIDGLLRTKERLDSLIREQQILKDVAEHMTVVGRAIGQEQTTSAPAPPDVSVQAPNPTADTKPQEGDPAPQ